MSNGARSRSRNPSRISCPTCHSPDQPRLQPPVPPPSEQHLRFVTDPNDRHSRSRSRHNSPPRQTSQRSQSAPSPQSRQRTHSRPGISPLAATTPPNDARQTVSQPVTQPLTPAPNNRMGSNPYMGNPYMGMMGGQGGFPGMNMNMGNPYGMMGGMQQPMPHAGGAPGAAPAAGAGAMGADGSLLPFDSSQMKRGRMGHYGYLEGRGEYCMIRPSDTNLDTILPFSHCRFNTRAALFRAEFS